MKQLVAVGLMCVIACGGSSSKPAQQPTLANTPEPAPKAAPEPAPEPPFDASTVSDAEFDATMNQAIAMFEAMAAATDAAAGDCGKLADGMATVMDDSKDFIESAKKWKDNAEMDKKAEEWMKGKMESMMPSMMKIGAATQKCGSDAKFAEVMKRMDDLK